MDPDGPTIEWNAPATLDRIVFARAALSPDAPAVIENGVTTSYSELIQRAARLSISLRDRGVARGGRVGVCADVSRDLFASILAIWAVGATYVPLDPQLPRMRIEHISSDSTISIVLVDRAYLELFGDSATIVFDEVVREPRSHLESIAEAEDVAYIIYTSGSTGMPKGVAVQHGGLRNAILASSESRAFTEQDRELFRSSIAFDVSLEELFCPLVAGGTVVVAPRSVWGEPRAFLSLIIANGITSIFVNPSFLAILLEEAIFSDCSSLRVVNCGGEALSAGLCARFFALSSAALFNSYGPSETTIVVTLHRSSPADLKTGEETVPIGKPLANCHVSVRDSELEIVATGEVGEIVIGGAQLANGYINRDAETNGRFVTDPTRPHRRLYRTGDLARVRHDGTIVFLGRNDRQVKIRGVRVEPAEVAAAIERLAGVRTAVVVPRRRVEASRDDSPILVAYVTLLVGAALDATAMRRELRNQLPLSMVPAEIFQVRDFPLTITGKIDEEGLVRREEESIRRDRRAPSFSEVSPFRAILHEQIRAIWEEILDVDGILDDDDFFDIGGDSLAAVRLVMRIEETFGRRVPVLDFFNSMTIAGLGNLLSSDAGIEERDAILLNSEGRMDPLVFLHGDLAGGLYSFALARMLGEDQPMLVIPPHGMRDRPPATDVRSMAADTIAIVRRYYPSLPVRIAGYSAAALVAYEAARMLRSAGREVTEVVIIGMGAETVAFSRLELTVRRLRLPQSWHEGLLRTVMRVSFRLERAARLRLRDRFVRIARVFDKQPARLDSRTEIEIALAAELRRYELSHETYIPGPYDGRVTVLWPEDQPVRNGNVERDWGRVASRVKLVRVPGTHNAAVSRYLDRIAEALREVPD
jgi:amino acid adenylation domain-containing protein